MYLFNIAIQGFRGIRSLDLRLGATSVLIGEHDWGKAALFDMLERCLAHQEDEIPTFSGEDLHRAGNKTVHSLRATFTFRESTKDEFNQKEFASFNGHTQVSSDRRSVELTIEASPDSDSKDAVKANVHIGPNKAEGDVDLLNLVRRYCPVLIVRPDRGIDSMKTAALSSKSDQKEKIEKQIEQVYDQIVSARHAVTPQDLNEAVADIGTLLQEHAIHAISPHPLAGELIQRLGRVPEQLSLADGPTLPIEKHGSSSQAISLLVLVGSILHAQGPRALDPAAMPLVVVEEPEAHLHPVLLAGIWSLIEGMQTQRLITTYSGILLASIPLYMLRRIVRTKEGSVVHRVQRKTLDADERRRIGYHIRSLRGHVLFARVWILIEGETEFWILPELARIFGHNLDACGVQLIEFAQCGVAPIAKLANELGIQWHLLTDGDAAGATYIQQAQQYMEPEDAPQRLMRFEEKDIEHHLWENGFASVYREASGRGPNARKMEQATSVIDAAIRANSKPDLALRVIEQAERMKTDGLLTKLRAFIESAVSTATAAESSTPD